MIPQLQGRITLLTSSYEGVVLVLLDALESAIVDAAQGENGDEQVIGNVQQVVDDHGEEVHVDPDALPEPGIGSSISSGKESGNTRLALFFTQCASAVMQPAHPAVGGVGASLRSRQKSDDPVGAWQSIAKQDCRCAPAAHGPNPGHRRRLREIHA